MSQVALLDEIGNRLESSLLKEPERDLVLGALFGELETVLRDGSASRPDEDTAPTTGEPAVAFLESICVRGFRGIGPPAVLVLSPGPGLTLVVGRNGSGKSSFAEALELLLTGSSARFTAKRGRIWREGWRNLHSGDSVEVSARLLVVGRRDVLPLRRSWNASAQLDDGATCVESGDGLTSIAELGWEQPLVAYRPFLSYEELGSMLDDGPSKLFDRLSSILGLEELTEAAGRLGEARKERERRDKDAKQAAKTLAERCAALAEESADERATAAAEAFAKRVWDLDALESLAHGDGAPAGEDGALATLRALASFVVPETGDVEELARRVDGASVEARRHAATGAASALRIADLLDRALAHHDAELAGATAGAGAPPEPLDCPVCRAPARLDAEWRLAAERERDELRSGAAALREARRTLATAVAELAAALPDPAPLLTRARAHGAAADAPLVGEGAPAPLPLHESLEVLRRLARTDGSDRGAAAAGHPDDCAQVDTGRLAESALATRATLAAVQERAAAELAVRDDRWRPIARELASFTVEARRATGERQHAKELEAAEKWLRDTATAMRNERFEPIKEQVLAHWALLRTRSHVALDDVRFVGRTTQRRIELAVTVDGHEGAALGVMSQGELHALALALFLPRATVPESPFRFVVVDDPVQAMDPARVDGLARVLESVAVERQVLVFTHDERLPEAVRRLGIDATILEVERESGSRVQVVRHLDDALRHLEEARALVRSEGVPVEVIERVVPGLCRMALEAACAEVVRRRRLGRGEPWSQVGRALDESGKLLPRLALALFDDGGRAGEVLSSVNGKWGRAAGDLIRTCNSGAHEGVRGADTKLVDETAKLVERIRRAAA